MAAVASRLRTAALGLLLAASLAGCVSIPTGGPVQSSTVTQGPGAEGQHYLQIVPKPPVRDWRPDQIVQGFLLASASFGYWQIAREYLAPTARWNPTWSAIVYSRGPTVSSPSYQKTKKGPPDTALVTVGGKVQATLSQNGGYAVPAAPSASGPQQQGVPEVFQLEKVDGQWRISNVPPYLLLSSYLFNSDYQLRNLYFFDPTYSYLVPDPTYVPLQATPVDLTKGLVNDLIHQPPDWLSHGTMTAFPPGTSLTDVTLTGGTATVNLSIAAGKGSPNKASQTLTTKTMQRVSAQLLQTLTGSGQSGSAVQSVELSVNGNPWNPPGSPGNPVQHLGQTRYSPATGSSGTFYYLDDGNLMEHNSTTTTRVARLGKEYSSIAVSPGPPGGQYLAALSGSTLYAGPLNGKLTKVRGGPYQTMSWDPSGDLWVTTNNEIFTMPAPDRPGQQLGQPVPVTVENSDGSTNAGPFNVLRVAPDGVRVAMIVNGSILDFGAIANPQPPAARANSPAAVKIVLSPFYVTATGIAMFNAVSWYGPDNVITLTEPGAALTEYPVNGGNATSIPSQAGIQSIAASAGNPLIAEVGKGGLMTDTSLSGAWPPAPTIKNGISPVYPG